MCFCVSLHRTSLIEPQGHSTYHNRLHNENEYMQGRNNHKISRTLYFSHLKFIDAFKNIASTPEIIDKKNLKTTYFCGICCLNPDRVMIYT